ncbi:hypothetical protein AMECASPLE_036225 [Ameca splendens]|uniref:Uncharacterized protein n=1 Tax=Ameca splendens TaxID=208324 RepID=A0ABV0XWW3_9TELE
MPKVVYCIHALSLYLYKLGIAPQIQDLLGKVDFTDSESASGSPSMYLSILLKFKAIIKMGKKGDLSCFKSGMMVGARQADLTIAETADLLGISHKNWSKKQ